MNWGDFLALAERLAGGSTEAEWRFAVSRAYYTVFHLARRLFFEVHFTTPRADRAHQYLVFRLSNSGEPTVEQAGRDMETLRRLRNRADYDDSPALTKSQATAAVKVAEAIIQSLDAARQERTRTRIMSAMSAYERDVL
jgi:uncharacterized protein (UPF0332 family)